MKNFILYIFLIFLVSCATATTTSVGLDTVVPSKPSPVEIQRVKWLVLDGNVCLSSTDGVKNNAEIKDTLRYIKDLQGRLCYFGDTQYCKSDIDKQD